MPTWVEKASRMPASTFESTSAGDDLSISLAEPELAPRQCKLSEYEKRKIPSVSVRSEVIAYASPDSTYAATKRLFDGARKSILIGIYDFSAPHMRQLVLDAIGRGVRVSLMLDIDGKDERELFDDLVDMGVHGVSAPSCANKQVRFFASSHEKVIVIDGEWTLVQSGNYSANSIPLNEDDGLDGGAFRTGNRDTGLAIRSKPLARLFTEILESDMELATAGLESFLPPVEDETKVLVEKKPPRRPTRLFPSKTFELVAALRIQPVLSPDNYMDVVPGLLEGAKKSIDIEQQYIRAHQPNIRILLEAIATARRANPKLKVRIVLGKVFNGEALEKEQRNLEILDEEFDLQLGTHIRYVNTDQLVHCHNKMIIVDGANVLVSSQNWSDFAVTKNREAGLWIPHGDIAQYFAQIFEVDWRSAVKALPEPVEETVGLEGLAAGRFLKVDLGDYKEV